MAPVVLAANRGLAGDCSSLKCLWQGRHADVTANPQNSSSNFALKSRGEAAGVALPMRPVDDIAAAAFPAWHLGAEVGDRHRAQHQPRSFHANQPEWIGNAVATGATLAQDRGVALGLELADRLLAHASSALRG
jgi:hypothetical protein